MLKSLTGVAARDRAIIYLNIGVCHFSMAQLDASEQYVNKAIEADSTYAKAHYRKILILQK